MTCPHCNEDTPSLFNNCEHCKADISEYKAQRNKALEGTGETYSASDMKKESTKLNLGPVGGVLIMIGAATWFLFEITYSKRIYFYAPVLFVIGIVTLVAGLKRGKRLKELKKLQDKGEVID